MNCEACGEKTSMNYGNERKTLCENCTETKTVFEGLDKEIMTGGIMQALGIISCIVGISAFLLAFSEGSMPSFISGVLFIMLGATMYTFGKLVPYIISIEESMRILKDKSVGKSNLTEEEREL